MVGLAFSRRNGSSSRWWENDGRFKKRRCEREGADTHLLPSSKRTVSSTWRCSLVLVDEALIEGSFILIPQFPLPFRLKWNYLHKDWTVCRHYSFAAEWLTYRQMPSCVMKENMPHTFRFRVKEQGTSRAQTPASTGHTLASLSFQNKQRNISKAEASV